MKSIQAIVLEEEHVCRFIGKQIQFFLSWKIFIIMINRQKHYTKYLHDKLETQDIRCIKQRR